MVRKIEVSRMLAKEFYSNLELTSYENNCEFMPYLVMMRDRRLRNVLTRIGLQNLTLIPYEFWRGKFFYYSHCNSEMNYEPIYQGSSWHSSP